MCQDPSENGRSSNTDAASTRARNGSPERRPSNPDSQASFTYQGVGRYNDDRRRDLGGSLRLMTEGSDPNGSRHSTSVEKSNIWFHDLTLTWSPNNHQYSNGKRSRDKMERDLDEQLERARVDGIRSARSMTQETYSRLDETRGPIGVSSEMTTPPRKSACPWPAARTNGLLDDAGTRGATHLVAPR
ncbi:uncharacterized protein VDAG_10263 [Verticillium dahliae VdLs.17]|uniref:Uncharacterized protein n=1 Tax=Verticillium dahliae (strain VdLs.17 / ATCC MYA-4575 / FGSC 10137) TaxID=498257 RepID=G2XJD1_VERDV|nr:uncharacterized protein VDAG_10263 [Verticillium dahliae VdLs.17]EGY20634.1 hypothetical protein VDAG_10263 [Verticillium dahliae VdLs.17]